MNLFKILLPISFLLLSPNTKSASFTVTDNLLDGLTLGEGSTTNSLFYVDNLLPDEPHSINSAYFEFHFEVLGDLVETSQSVPDERRFFDSEIESVLLQIGTISTLVESTYEIDRFIYDQRITVDPGCALSPIPASCVPITVDQYQENEGYFGFLNPISGFLSGADLLSLQSSGLIFWSLDMLAGEIILDSATLTVDYDLNEVAAVPLPAGLWLFGTALIGLVGFSRRRKAS